MTGTTLATVVFLVFVAVVFFSVYRILKRESAADTPV